MVSALLMWLRLLSALRVAFRQEDFARVLSAGLLLIAVGTLTYAFGADWNFVYAFYFAVATLTTSSIADPELVIESRWLKVFTAFYVLLGIGILVEIGRRLGMSFIVAREETAAAKRAGAEHGEAPRPREP
mgnify:CR=1 FL=1